ncbi:MAG TPA: prepilin-type N-terminal cleavage/methylation domain-containing protein [Candidatus Didemnitutus sp.]
MKPTSLPPSRRRSTRGFTLVEIMIAVALLGFVVMGTVKLLTQALRTYYYDSGRLRVNRDIRTFTQYMDTDAAYSNYFLIFPNFTNRSSGSPAVDAYVADGQSGDFLLLVTIFSCTTDNTGPSGTAVSGLVAGHNYVTKLVGYYRDATTTTTGPVRRFSVDVSLTAAHPADLTTAYYTSPGPPMATLLNLVEPTSNQSTNSVVVQIAEGLAAGSSTSGLFYDFQDKSIMVRGQIIETDNGTINDTNRKAVNTYNFTVSPRG